MENPLHTLGYKFLNASLQADSSDQTGFSQLSRRGFMLLAASLSSCAAADPLKPQTAAPAAAAPVKTNANT
ncbi:MAG: hypothetical protein RLZZ214_3411, partial [Verrucomicrobiota bacterium]